MLTVYHGSVYRVVRPLVGGGRVNLDFGPGFYVTDVREQAENWANVVWRRNSSLSLLLNVYELDMERVVGQEYRTLRFEAYDEAWLDFIASNRKGGGAWREYDLEEGGVANDRVFDAIEAYLDGLASKETALGLLAYQHPNNQLCLLRQRLIDDCLRYVRTEELQKGGGA